MNIGEEQPANITMPVYDGVSAPRPTLVREPNDYVCVGPSPLRRVWVLRRANNPEDALIDWEDRAIEVDGGPARDCEGP